MNIYRLFCRSEIHFHKNVILSRRSSYMFRNSAWRQYPCISNQSRWRQYPCILTQSRCIGVMPILEVLEALNVQAQTLRDGGNPEKALPLYMEIAEGLQGDNDTLNLNLGYTYGNIALCHLAMQNHEKALHFYEEALKILRRAHDERFPLLGLLYIRVGICHSALGDDEKGLEFFLKAEPIVEANYDSEHADVANVYQNLAGVLFKLNRFQEAGKYLKKLAAIQMKVFGAKDARTLSTQEAIRTAEEKEKAQQ